jgi:hypothetical protein
MRKRSILIAVCFLILFYFNVSEADVKKTSKKLRKQTTTSRTIIPVDEEKKALNQAQAWLKSINYNLTLEQVKNLKRLRLQLYGSFNGVSTQTLISNQNMRHLQVLKNLEILALPTWTSDEGLSNVAGLTKLQTLNLPNARITNAGMVYIKNLTQMRSLVLTAANIDDAGVTNLSSLTNLYILNLSNTGITDAGMATVGKLAGLNKLFLNRTSITDASIPHIIKLKWLERLDITGAKISAAGRQRIQEAIPGITIH